MKIQTSRFAGTSGTVLLVTLCTAIIIGLTLASYLLLVQNQSVSVQRSQAWNDSMVVTEAGVEDALELINKNAGTPNMDGWTNTYAQDGWTANGNVYSVRRYLNATSNVYYDVYVTNVNGGPVIGAIGHVPTPQLYAQAAPQSFFAAAGLNVSGTALARAVAVQTKKDPMFNFALAARQKIDLKGNNVATDSFDSSDPNYSNPDGTYNSSKDKAGGDVVADGTITNSISVGNANIKGHVKTGPNGNITIGPQGSVGDTSWVNSNTHGIEPGYASSDLNVSFPDVPSPNFIYGNPTWFTGLPAGGPVNVNGTLVSFANAVTASGYYQLSSLGGTIYIGTNANVVIWVTGSSSFSGQDQITIAQGGSLTIYAGGPFSTAGNAAINNYNQNAANFYLLGLPTCTSMSINGNAAITGVIYAPEATLSLGGGGNNNYDFVGSGMANTVTLNGHFNFHYDEALKNRGFGRGYIPTSWAETF